MALKITVQKIETAIFKKIEVKRFFGVQVIDAVVGTFVPIARYIRFKAVTFAAQAISKAAVKGGWLVSGKVR